MHGLDVSVTFSKYLLSICRRTERNRKTGLQTQTAASETRDAPQLFLLTGLFLSRLLIVTENSSERCSRSCGCSFREGSPWWVQETTDRVPLDASAISSSHSWIQYRQSFTAFLSFWSHEAFNLLFGPVLPATHVLRWAFFFFNHSFLSPPQKKKTNKKTPKTSDPSVQSVMVHLRWVQRWRLHRWRWWTCGFFIATLKF